MHKTIGLAICLFFSSFLTGCPQLIKSSSSGLSMENFYIETDQTLYLAEEGDSLLEITYAYVNKNKQAFYPGSCLGHTTDVLEKFVGGEWIVAYKPVCPDVLRPPIKIEGGVRIEATIQLTPSTWDPEWANSSWKGGDIEGKYRIRELVYSEWDMEKFDKGTLPSEIIFSNEFEIRRAP